MLCDAAGAQSNAARGGASADGALTGQAGPASTPNEYAQRAWYRSPSTPAKVDPRAARGARRTVLSVGRGEGASFSHEYASDSIVEQL